MHFYRECLDEDNVYLKLTKENLSLNMEFSIKDFAKIACTFDMQSLERQCELSDEQIRDYCKSQVDERIGSQGVKAFCGISVFGSSSLPREQQELNGFNFFVSRRNKLRGIMSEIKSRRSMPMRLGLEDIVSVNYDE
jgi:hypothetical protein